MTLPPMRPLEASLVDLFQHLGIDYNHTSYLDHTGRPMPILPGGAPIAELH